MAHIMIGMATENNLGYLISLNHIKPDVLMLLETSRAHNENFGKSLTAYCKKQGITLKREFLPSDDSVRGLLDFLFDRLNEYTGYADRITLNLAGGTKVHNIALWELFRTNPLCAHALFVNLQSSEITEWHRKDDTFKEQMNPLNTDVGIDDILSLYNLTFDFTLNLKQKDARKQLKRIMMQPFKGAQGSDGGRGEQFERACADALLGLLEAGRLGRCRAIYFNAKIKNELGKTRAEYDFLIQTTQNELILVECKAGNAFTLKDLKAQKELASEWGGAFARFAAFISPPSDAESTSRLLSFSETSETFGIHIFTGPSILEVVKGLKSLKDFEYVMRLNAPNNPVT